MPFASTKYGDSMEGKKAEKAFVIALILINLLLAESGSIGAGLVRLQENIQGFFGALIAVLIVLAAIAYAAGNMLGSDAGARAKVWGQNLLIGAGISLVVYVVAPMVLQSIVGDSMNINMDAGSISVSSGSTTGGSTGGTSGGTSGTGGSGSGGNDDNNDDSSIS